MNSRQRRKRDRELRDEIDALSLQYRILTGWQPRDRYGWESAEKYASALRQVIGHHRELRGQPALFDDSYYEGTLDALGNRQQVPKSSADVTPRYLAAKAAAAQAA